MKSLTLLLLCCVCLSAYEKPEAVSQADWEEATPYFLPLNHPLKSKVDKVFRSFKRPILMTAAATLQGFELIRINDKSGLVIARHPKLKGYVVKFIPDQFPSDREIYNFTKRVKGAEIIRQGIDNLGWHKDFNVVKKWIYPLPIDRSPLPEGFVRKYFVLIAEEAKMGSDTKNALLWQSDFVTEEKLFKLHHLVRALGLNDSLFIDNIPITADGRITFIDTEHSQHWNISWDRFAKYLSPEMQAFWMSLVYP